MNNRFSNTYNLQGTRIQSFMTIYNQSTLCLPVDILCANFTHFLLLLSMGDKISCGFMRENASFESSKELNHEATYTRGGVIIK